MSFLYNLSTTSSRLLQLYLCEIKYEYLKFLCDSNYFNTDRGEWNYKKRREILFKIGNVEEKTKELNNLSEFELIKSDLDKGLTTSEIICIWIVSAPTNAP